MSAEDKSVRMLYTLLVLVLIVGIVGAVFLQYLIPREKDPFSSVSFLEPDTLPNLVRVGSTYDFEYEIESFENSTTEYDVNTNLQLFRLYDTTEGLYSCLSPYRRKVYLRWENETNLSHVSIGKLNEIIPDLSIQPDKNNPVTWRTYHLAFTAGRAFGVGELVLWFGDANNTKYQFSINSFTKKVYFGGEHIGDVNISNQNDKIKIDYDGKNLKFTYNEDIIFDRPVEDATNGQFGFETRDMFVTISQMSIRKDNIIEVPDRGNVWDYSIDTNVYYTLLKQSREKTSKNVYMWRSYINTEEDEELIRKRTESPGIISDLLNKTEEEVSEPQEIKPIECENDFACNYLRTDDAEYFIDEITLTDLGLSIPQTKYGRRFWLEPRNKDEAIIPWSNFELEARYDSLYVRDSIMFLLGDKFGLMFTNKSISTMVVKPSGIEIKQYPFKVQRNQTINGIRQDNFTIKVEDKYVKVIAGEHELALQLEESLYNVSPRMIHMNTFSSVREIILKNSNPSCDKEEFYEFCEVIYNFEGGRVSFSREPDPEQFGKIILGSGKNPLSPEDDEITNPDNDTTIQDKGIPSKIIAFNGPLTTVNNKTNFTFKAKYKYLDGEGNIKITFYDLDGETIASMTSMPIDDSVVIIDNTEGQQTYLRYNHFIKDDLWHEFSIKVYEDNISFIHNRTTIATILVPVTSGFFSIGTEDTHAELRDVHLEYFSERKGRRLPLLDDPCQLRLVHQEPIHSENFSLEPKMSKIIQNKFKLNHFFDYGLINVSLQGSSGTNSTPLDIHFWMVRS